MAKNISKVKASATNTAEQSQVEEVRSLKDSKTINTGIDRRGETVYMDFAI